MSDRDWEEFNRFVGKLNDPCPIQPGTKIRLLAMGSDPFPVPPGTLGEVTGGTGAQVHVRWENGSRLLLLPENDHWEVVDE